MLTVNRHPNSTHESNIAGRKSNTTRNSSSRANPWSPDATISIRNEAGADLGTYRRNARTSRAPGRGWRRTPAAGVTASPPRRSSRRPSCRRPAPSAPNPLQPGRPGRQRQEAAAAERERGDGARRGDAVRGPARTMLRCQPTRRIWFSADGAHDRPFREARGCGGV